MPVGGRISLIRRYIVGDVDPVVVIGLYVGSVIEPIITTTLLTTRMRPANAP